MIYYPNLNFVYCPVERTASRSTEAYISAHDPDGGKLSYCRHICSLDLLSGINPTKIYVSSRHPWDRLCSMFAYDKTIYESGYKNYWTTIDEYLEHLANIAPLPFLTQDNLDAGNIIRPMYKRYNNSFFRSFRSQTSYRSVLDQSGLTIVTLEYKTLSAITNEDWANPSIIFPTIGASDSQADALYSVEREDALMAIWPEDFNGYSRWSVV